MQKPRRHLFTLILYLFCCCASLLPHQSLAAASDSAGKFRVYTRRSQDGEDHRGKDTVVLWSNAEIDKDEVFDTVIVAWGKVNFHGRAKDLVVVGGEVTLYEDSRVDGSLVVLGGKLHKLEGAKVSEQVLFELPSHLPGWIAALGPVLSFVYSDGAALLYLVVRAVFVCLFGALLYMLAPELMLEAETMAQTRPLKSVLWALLGLFLFVPGIVVLAISILGIMFIPLFICFYGFIYYFCAFVMAANILGHNLPPRDSIVMPPLRLFYGVFIFILLAQLPYFGNLLTYLAMLFTSGAMFYTFFHRLRGRMRA